MPSNIPATESEAQGGGVADVGIYFAFFEEPVRTESLWLGIVNGIVQHGPTRGKGSF